MKLLKLYNRKQMYRPDGTSGKQYNSSDHGNNHFYSEESFNELLSLERRRTERTKIPICLMLFDVERLFRLSSEITPYSVIPVLVSSVREIDMCGWHKFESSIGIIFTALDETELEGSIESIRKKIRENLLNLFNIDIVESISISCHIFPEERDFRKSDLLINEKFYPEAADGNPKNLSDVAKRVMDIAGGIAGLLLFMPFFIIIPLLIKLTSVGPVLFRQERIGQYGRKFTFLKFRSMFMNSDDRIHREYIKQLMAGKSYEKGGDTVFKITNDPRITPLGKFLRKSSLDELPQFINVLLGDMSLVGPRPPIPYEFRSYDAWHRNRLMKCKPGITGLWQVKGRSLTTFDGMVRMDLAYIRTWSLWLDVKILLQTPLAVLKCRGAY